MPWQTTNGLAVAELLETELQGPEKTANRPASCLPVCH